MTARETLDKGMAEDALLTAVVEAALWFGWLVHHDRRSDKALQQGSAGFPDVVLVRDGRIKFLELKSAKGQVTQEQLAWQLALRNATWAVEYRVVKPTDLDDVIESLR